MFLANYTADWMRHHLAEIALSITAMVFVIAGPILNSGLKKFTQHLNWLIRYGLFLLLTTIGYGILTNISLHFMRRFLLGLRDLPLVIVVISFHLFMAWLLKRDRAI